jgi:hypothetical protein
MTGEFLSTHAFLFICGLALGFVLRSRDLKAAPQPASPTWAAPIGASATWNDVPWSEITRIDGDTAFAPQLVKLHEALLHPRSVDAAACASPNKSAM